MTKIYPLFIRGIAVVYLIAFASLLPQILGLIGADGILPVAPYLDAIHRALGAESYWVFPTLAWLNSSDTFLLAMCWAGVLLSIVLLAGYIRIPALAALFILYLSITTIGQDFLLFQWDALLLEAGFAAMLVATTDVSTLPRWALRILIFRLMLESGLAKLRSGDPNWRNLTALKYHFETQPLPTPLAWYAHQLPEWFLRLTTAGMFFVELLVPLFFLLPYRRLRIAAASLTIALQLGIAATGNYTFFNLLTIVLCIPLFERDGDGAPAPKRLFASTVAGILIVVGLLEIVMPGPIPIVVDTIDMLHIVNRYGLFAVMTTQRPEIIIEGSDDGKNWKAYEFKYKPGDPMNAPRWVAPYQPRLDWQMWFAALSDYQSTPWFQQLMLHVLQGTPRVLSLLKSNPFPDHAPRFVRASLYQYHFSRTTGAWWTRSEAGLYFPAISLR